MGPKKSRREACTQTLWTSESAHIKCPLNELLSSLSQFGTIAELYFGCKLCEFGSLYQGDQTFLQHVTSCHAEYYKLNTQLEDEKTPVGNYLHTAGLSDAGSVQVKTEPEESMDSTDDAQAHDVDPMVTTRTTSNCVNKVTSQSPPACKVELGENHVTHPPVAVGLGDYLYECLICPQSFANEQLLIRHMTTHNTNGEDGEQEVVKISKIRSKIKNTSNKKMATSVPALLVSEDNYVPLLDTGRKGPKNSRFGSVPLIAAKKCLPKGWVQCALCPFTGRLDSYNAHIAEHTRDRAFQCSELECHYGCDSEVTLQRHIERGHQLPKVHCMKCDYSGSRPEYRIHLRRHTGELPFKCPACDLCFGKRTLAKRHYLSKHTANPVQVMKAHQKFYCHLCKNRYLTPQKLKDHLLSHSGIRAHSGIRRHKCAQCDASFQARDTLAQHVMDKHGGERFICEVCGKEFATNPRLIQHSTVHTGEMPFKCEICGSVFRLRKTYIIHKIVHTKGKSFCAECKVVFRSRASFDRHNVKRHDKLHCDACDVSFVTAAEMLEHDKIHEQHETSSTTVSEAASEQAASRDVVLECDVCDMMFATKAEMREHDKMHDVYDHVAVK